MPDDGGSRHVTLVIVTQARNADLRAFYASKEESTRLTSREGRVEFLRTQQMLREALEPDSRILDVGGADGVHAEWLVGDSHEVVIVDIVPLHVERALFRGFVAQEGDARNLPLADNTFDAVLLLGPLYHLIDSADRATALSEARRVLRPGGLLAAAAVTRIAVALDCLRKGRLNTSEAHAMAARIVADGHDDTGFGPGIFYFHTVEELRHELVDAGFDDVSVRGVEGPAWPLIDPACPPDDPMIAHVAAIASLADGDSTLVGASSHLLALARV